MQSLRNRKTLVCIFLLICTSFASPSSERDVPPPFVKSAADAEVLNLEDGYEEQQQNDDMFDLTQEELKTTYTHAIEKRASDLLSTVANDTDAALVQDVPLFRGPPGRDGRDGKDGRDGRDGVAGSPGPTCDHGPVSSPGSPGPEGPSGSPGMSGSVGSPGLPGQLPPDIGTGSSHYIRWGRTVCPASATLVYAGIAAGGYYNHHASVTKLLCLPETPQYDRFDSGREAWRGYIVSVEYRTSDFAPLSSFYGHDVPCAVCSVDKRGRQMMLPALKLCPQGWTREYYGYLMGQDTSYAAATESVCLDRSPERVPGSSSVQNTAFIVPMEGRCDGDGNIPCSPYVDGHELTCVVCTM